MNRLSKTVRTFVLALAVAAVGLMAAIPALAKDRVHLKDGRVLEGEILREVSGAVWIKIGPGEMMIRPDQIERIERDPEKPVASAEAPSREEPAATIPDGATRIAFISLESMVGPYFNKDAIERSVEMLEGLSEDRKPDIVVFVIDSGGGALFELMKIVPYIQEEVKPKFRTVAWIRSAISAAAMTSWVIEEIYMMSEGNIGACTGYMMEGGGAKAMEGDQLEEVLVWMEQVSRWGGHDPYVMRAMQVLTLLSATKDENGHISWYIDEPPSGEVIVSPKSEILSFSAHDAVKWGVARGIADNKEELARAMGCNEWVEVGQEAEDYQREFRENVGQAEVRIEEHWNKLNIALSFAESAPNKKERDRNVGEARKHLRAMQSWVRRAPSLEVYMNLTPEFFREMDRRLRDLSNQT